MFPKILNVKSEGNILKILKICCCTLTSKYFSLSFHGVIYKVIMFKDQSFFFSEHFSY
jgi:hypothetical protein